MTNEEMQAKLVELARERDDLRTELARLSETRKRGCDCADDEACVFVRERDEARARVAELEAEPSCTVKWNGGDLLLVWQGSGSMRVADLGLCRVEALARAREEQRAACARQLKAKAQRMKRIEDRALLLLSADIIRATPLDATPLADANAKLREALVLNEEALDVHVRASETKDEGDLLALRVARAALDATKEGL